MKMAIFWLSVMVMATVPLFFVMHRVYKDGIVGRSALLGISFFSTLYLLDASIGRRQYDVSWIGVGLATSVAAFLVWHLWRFHSRVLRKESAQYPPGCPQDRRSVPDRRFQP